jgi:tetratricopeptide (TPR) repeat protein
MKKSKSQKGTNFTGNEIGRIARGGMESVLSQLGGSASRGSALDRAQEIMYEAFEEPNPEKRVQLALTALEVSRDCADAYVLIAEHLSKNANDAIEHYRRGVEAGERAIGKKNFQEYKGHFWGVLETRPYMRARAGLAQSLWEVGKRDEALDHYRGMLELNPNDNQGIRNVLLACLLDMKLDDEASVLLRAYEDDATAQWSYSNALVAFRRKGDTAESRRLLENAIECNEFVPNYLLGMKKIPRNLPDYIGFGDASEAVAYAGDNLSAWRNTYGALGWLKDFVRLVRRKA